MKNFSSIFLADWTGGIIVTIISIIVTFAIIGGLLFYVKGKNGNKKGMVHNRKKPNDNPEKGR